MKRLIRFAGLLVFLGSAAACKSTGSTVKDLVVTDSKGIPYLFFQAKSEDQSTALVCRMTCRELPNFKNLRELCNTENGYAPLDELKNGALASFVGDISNAKAKTVVRARLSETQQQELEAIFNKTRETYDLRLGDPAQICQSGLKASQLKPIVIELRDEPFLHGFKGGFAIVSVGGKKAYINKAGTFLGGEDLKFDDAFYFSEGFAVVKLNGKAGFIDQKGKYLNNNAPSYDEALRFSDGFAPVKVNGKWGFIDQKGNYLNGKTPAYDFAFPFSEGLAAVRIDGKEGFIDKSGHYLNNEAPKYADADSFSEGLATVRLTGRPIGVVDKSGNYSEWGLESETFVAFGAEFSEGWLVVYADKKYGFVNKSGKFLNNQGVTYEFADRFSEGFGVVNMGGKYGFIDTSGKYMNDEAPKYESADPFSEGFALVKLDGKYGFIDKTGHYLNGEAPKYDYAMNFSEDLAPVRLGKTWHYIDQRGVPVLTFNFSSASK